jgi:hypothetical protein
MVLLVVLLIVLSVLFGGFQKGTRVNGMGTGTRVSVAAAGEAAARAPQQPLA